MRCSRTVPLPSAVDVRSVRVGGWLPVEAHAKGDRRAAHGRPHHEVHIARLEADRPAGRSAAVAVAARREIAQAPDGAHSLRPKRDGGG